MAINENTMQINSFHKGMNSDVSYSMLQDGQYIMAKNIRITAGNNESALKLTQEPFGEVWFINGLNRLSSDLGTDIKADKILACTTIRDYGVLIFQDDTSWKVAVLKPGDISFKKVFDSKQTTKRERFSVVAKYETEKVVKLYIASGDDENKNPIVLLNIADLYTNSKYIEGVDNALIYSKVQFTVPQVTITDGGTLKGALVQYSYRLYDKYLSATEISPACRLQPLTLNRNGKPRGVLPTETSNKSADIKIKIHEQDQVREYIQVFRTTYVQNGQLPMIEMIYDNKYNISDEGYFQYTDDGSMSIAELSLEEYNSISGVHIVPEVLESKDDILFASKINIDETAWEVDIDNSDNSFVSIEETAGDSFVVDANIDYNYIFLSDFTFTPSLRSGESYKYGIVFYNKFGIASKVYPIGIVLVGEDFPFKLGVNSDNVGQLFATPKGVKVKINIKKLPADVESFEIVRRIRTIKDSITISQGVISRPATICTNIDGMEDQYGPTGFISIDPISVESYKTSYPDFVLFVSPEVLYSKTDLKNIIDTYNTQLKFKRTLYLAGDIVSGNYTTYDKETLYQYRFDHKKSLRTPGLTNYTEPSSLVYDEKSMIRNYYIYSGSSIYKVLEGSHGLLAHWFFYNADLTDWNYYSFEFSSFKNTNSLKELLAVDSAFTLEQNRDNAKNHANVKKCIYNKYYDTEDGYEKIVSSKDYTEINNSAFAYEFTWNEPITSGPDNSAQTHFVEHPTYLNAQAFHNIIHTIDPKKDDSNFRTVPKSYEFTGIGGRCLLLRCNIVYDDLVEYHPNGISGTTKRHSTDLQTVLCNLQRSGTITPYSDVYNEVYYGFGDIVDLNDYNYEEEVSVDVFDGDTFLNLTEYVSCHKYYSAVDAGIGMQSAIIYALPLESNINLLYNSGDTFSSQVESDNYEITNLQIEPSNVNTYYNQERPLYQYNTAYSMAPTVRPFYTEYQERDDQFDKIDVRTYYTSQKLYGSNVDTWTKFQPANYLDVDSKYGLITHLRNFYDKLFFWQEHAIGVFSVNERTQITDDSNLPLILGTGGVLTRYDYLDQTAGMKANLFCDAVTPSTLYWFDEENNEIKSYRSGGGITSLTKSLGVLNIMNQYKKTDSTQNNILFYDKTHDEVVSKVLKDKLAVAYSESLNAFTSLYDLKYDDALVFPTVIYALGKALYKYDEKYAGTRYDANGNNLVSEVEYVVNKYPLTTKVFDNQEYVVNGSFNLNTNKFQFKYDTELGNTSTHPSFTNREHNWRCAVPRSGNNPDYGERLRGKYLKCKFSVNHSTDTTLSDSTIQYIITKFRTSWS